MSVNATGRISGRRERIQHFSWRATLLCLLGAYLYAGASVSLLALAWGFAVVSFALQFSAREWRQPVRPALWGVLITVLATTGFVFLRGSPWEPDTGIAMKLLFLH